MIKTSKNKPTAVIIKGNPKFIKDNPVADDFYSSMKDYLEDIGYSVSMDPGKPYTSPETADLWVGHSRGIDRLRFAPDGVSTVKADNYQDWDMDNPNDYDEDGNPKSKHYELTTELKEALGLANFYNYW